jgi:hypothetical protein
LLQKTTESDFVAAAASPDAKKNREQHCEAWYYAGMRRLLAADKKLAADYFTKCLATETTNLDEYVSAKGELKALNITH